MANSTVAVCDAAAQWHSERLDGVESLPTRPLQSGAKAARHSRKLSLNFPIVVPSQSQPQSRLTNPGRTSLESPSAPTPIDSPRLSPAHVSVSVSAASTQLSSPQKPA